MNGPVPIRNKQWVLISAAAFLPLSISYLPEFLQKNMFGLLLLSILIFYSQRLLRRSTGEMSAVSAALVLLIVVSHYGTLAATALYGMALILAHAVVNKTARKTWVFALLLLGGGSIALVLIYLLDAQRFRRLFSTWGLDGRLARCCSGQRTRDRGQVLASLGGVLAFYGLLFACYRIYVRKGSSLAPGDRVFWLANIFFCGSAGPACARSTPDGETGLVHQHSSPDRVRSCGELRSEEAMAEDGQRGCPLALVVAMLAFGELLSTRIHNRNHEAILTDIETLQARHSCPRTISSSPEPAQITSATGSNGVKAGVIHFARSPGLRQIRTHLCPQSHRRSDESGGPRGTDRAE